MAAAPDRWLLLLGSNLDREASMARALRRLGERFPVLARSRVVETDAVGDPDGPRFHNRAVLVRAGGTAEGMRDLLHGIEAALGRDRSAGRNAPRTMDIDILLAVDAAGSVLAEPPVHRDLRRHHYAALPAAEIAGDLVLPADGGTVAAAARALGAAPAGLRVLEAEPVTGG